MRTWSGLIGSFEYGAMEPTKQRLFFVFGRAARHGLTALEVFAPNSWVLADLIWQFRPRNSAFTGWLIYFQSCFACFAVGPLRASPTSTNQPGSQGQVETESVSGNDSSGRFFLGFDL